MKTTLLFISVETRPQYGTDEIFYLGMFDDLDKLDLAKRTAHDEYNDMRYSFVEIHPKINDVPKPVAI